MPKKTRLKVPKPRNAVARALADARYHKRIVPDARRKILLREARRQVKEIIGRIRRRLLPVIFST